MSTNGFPSLGHGFDPRSPLHHETLRNTADKACHHRRDRSSLECWPSALACGKVREIGTRVARKVARGLRSILGRLGVRSTSWGDWHGLDGADNRARYEAIETLRLRHAPHARVLDLGCGAGVLCGHLTTPVSYMGIDLQPAAIDAARATHHERPETDFRCGSINDLAILNGERFGLIVFNEVLYYQPTVDAALALVEAYRQHLEPGGLLLVSIYRDDTAPHRLNGPLCDALHERYRSACLTTMIVHRDPARRWQIGVYRPGTVQIPSTPGSMRSDRKKR